MKTSSGPTTFARPNFQMRLVLFAVCAIVATARADAAEINTGPHAPIPHLGEPGLQLGSDDHYLRVSGHINKGLLVYDDGTQILDYWLVDNANSSTRARIEGFNQVSGDLAVRGVVEGQWTPYSTNTVDQISRGIVDWNTTRLRRAEVWLEHDRYGRLWLGQGSMSSDGVGAADLSGTRVVGTSSVADPAGGQFLRNSTTGLLSSVRVLNAFSAPDGLNRLLRARYDSPQIGGFRFSAAYGKRVIPNATGKPSWDAALRFRHTFAGASLQAAAGYGRTTTGYDILAASVSTRFSNGFNATINTGGNNRDGITRHFIYGKIGHIGDWFSIGETALSLDAYIGRNFDTAGSESTSFGFQAVQSFDQLRTEMYLGVRSYLHSGATVAYKNSWGVLTGARTTF